MTQEELGELLKKGNLVRGYVYPYQGVRHEYLFEHSPSNIANFIMQHSDAREIILTDMLDNKILNTIGNFIDICPDQTLLPQILEHLIPMQTGKRKPKEFPVATMKEVNDFYEAQARAAEFDPLLEPLADIPVDAGLRTIRLVSPLCVQVFDPEIDEFNYTPSPVSTAAPYADEINRAIEGSLVTETPGGLMDYWHGSDTVRHKVVSLKPYVEFIDGELMGVCDMVCKADLMPRELSEVKDYLSGQYSDGWGEGFEQRPIKTQDGELYISFWDSENFSIRTELAHHMRTHALAKPKPREPQR